MPGNPQSFMFVFPGQGSQYRGMGSDLHEQFAPARAVYQRASEVLDLDMAELSFRDPENVLGLTAYTQPALLTHSIACLEVFRDLTDGEIEPTIAAGHSLGEYSALVAAQVLDFDEAVRLVRRRGELMSEYSAGKMLAVPMAVEEVRPFAELHYCGIGGCNLPNQTVIGGLEADLDQLADALKKHNRRARATRLDTEGAFHTYLMVEAAIHFREELNKVEFRDARCQLLSNFSGAFHDPDPDRIRYQLFFQLFNPVRWIWGMERALEKGVGVIIEFGGGLGRDESPASKRPNLASIIGRTIKARRGRHGRRDSDTSELDFAALYAPAINAGTVTSAANLARALGNLSDQPSDDDSQKLFIPTSGGIPLAKSIDLLSRVGELGLLDKVELVTRDIDEMATPRLHFGEGDDARNYYGDQINEVLVRAKTDG